MDSEFRRAEEANIRRSECFMSFVVARRRVEGTWEIWTAVTAGLKSYEAIGIQTRMKSYEEEEGGRKVK